MNESEPKPNTGQAAEIPAQWRCTRAEFRGYRALGAFLRYAAMNWNTHSRRSRECVASPATRHKARGGKIDQG